MGKSDNDSFWREEKYVVRRSLALLGMLLVLGCGAWSPARAERMALGLIVKMKDTQGTPPVVRLAATLKQREQPQKLRERVFSAARRAQVPFAFHRQTAFAANLIHAGRPMALSEARAQAERLRRDPDVAWVIVNELEQPQAVGVPNDPLLVQQTWLSNRSDGGYPNIPAAWSRLSELSPVASPVVVAVLDTGVLRHPDLQGGRVLFDEGYDFVADAEYSNDNDGLDGDATDPGDYITQAQINGNRGAYGSECPAAQDSSWHGTAIAGVLGAQTDNSFGVAGMLYQVPGPVVLPVRVAGQCGAAVIDIVEGMLWAAGIDYNGKPAKVNQHPARVISLSFGGDSACNCDRSRYSEGSCLYVDTIAALKEKGAVLVAASGNSSGSNVDGGTATARPANCSGVLAVTALNRDGAKARYANFVPSSGVATLGGDGELETLGIYTTSNFGRTTPSLEGGVPKAEYKYMRGTSFSTPIAAGVVAMMWSANPGLSVDALLDGLRTQGVRPHTSAGQGGACGPFNAGACRCTTSSCGAGVVDADRAVAWAAAQTWSAYSAPSVTATFFDAGRVRAGSSSTSNSGGGGGALDAWMLVALALATALGASQAAISRRGHTAV